MTSWPLKSVVRASRQRLAAMEQDKAAGGIERRKIHTKTGSVAIVSLSAVTSGDAWRMTLRFKWGGSNVQRPVGTVKAATRPEALRLGWLMLRRKRVVESNGWSWVDHGDGN